ncbi:MAG: LPS translocon maturation chaperone LptM [Rhodanobacteraceae bacterium]
MRRHVVPASLLLMGISVLTGCGQKGPLVLPPPRPVVPAPATSVHQQPAPAAALPAPATSPASPVTARNG